jgi:hypothetical protein
LLSGAFTVQSTSAVVTGALSSNGAVSKPEQSKYIVDRAIETYGRMDILVARNRFAVLNELVTANGYGSEGGFVDDCLD